MKGLSKERAVEKETNRTTEQIQWEEILLKEEDAERERGRERKTE